MGGRLPERCLQLVFRTQLKCCSSRLISVSLRTDASHIKSHGLAPFEQWEGLDTREQLQTLAANRYLILFLLFFLLSFYFTDCRLSLLAYFSMKNIS